MPTTLEPAAAGETTPLLLDERAAARLLGVAPAHSVVAGGLRRAAMRPHRAVQS